MNFVDPFRLTAGLRRYDAFRTAAVGVGQEARFVRSTCCSCWVLWVAKRPAKGVAAARSG